MTNEELIMKYKEKLSLKSYTPAMLNLLCTVYAEGVEDSEINNAPRWISVDDEMPQPIKMVLIADADGSVYKGWYSERNGWNTHLLTDVDLNVTHWMPLPPPPVKPL